MTTKWLDVIWNSSKRSEWDKPIQWSRENPWLEYCKYDVESVESAITTYLKEERKEGSKFMAIAPNPKVKRAIFNNPATIIYWTDGTKTVVKCQEGDSYDPEKGFVMAYLKKLLGNDNTFNKEINRWVYDK